MKKIDIIGNIKECLKEFEIIHGEIETTEDYLLFLNYLKLLATKNEIKNNAYGVGVSDIIYQKTLRKTL